MFRKFKTCKYLIEENGAGRIAFERLRAGGRTIFIGLVNRRNPLSNLKIHSMRVDVEAALPPFDTLAVRLLANMAIVAFDRSAISTSVARSLQTHVFDNFDNGLGDFTMIIGTAHITAFMSEMIAITDFGLFGTTVVFLKSFRRGLSTISIKALVFLIDWNKFFGFEARRWQSSEEEVLRPTSSWGVWPIHFR